MNKSSFLIDNNKSKGVDFIKKNRQVYKINYIYSDTKEVNFKRVLENLFKKYLIDYKD